MKNGLQTVRIELMAFRLWDRYAACYTTEAMYCDTIFAFSISWQNISAYCVKFWNKSQVFASWSFHSLGEIKLLVLAELGTKEII